MLEREEPGRPCIEGGRIQSANVELGARIRIRGWERGRGRRDVAAAASECDGEGGSRSGSRSSPRPLPSSRPSSGL